jgi:hypothetical protein
MLAKQVLYHMSLSPSPVLLFFILKIYLFIYNSNSMNSKDVSNINTRAGGIPQ